MREAASSAAGGSRRLSASSPPATAKRSSSPASLVLARLTRLLPASRLLRLLLVLALVSLVPPAFFRLRLRRFHRMRERKCRWIATPPMVCSHGGDSTNSMDAFRQALNAPVRLLGGGCLEAVQWRALCTA
ncbi:hypothetical protein ACP70R_001590 [Stipagrostis hirtigluma subsp. patula]